MPATSLIAEHSSASLRLAAAACVGMLSSTACAAGSTATDLGSDADVDSGSVAAQHKTSDTDAVPATCAEAHEKVGCCANNHLYYCDSTFTSKACTGTKVCGWDATKSYYDCMDPPAATDPSGVHPLSCD